MAEFAYGVVICPDCASGKHQNCPVNSWDNLNDRPALCPCYEAGHELTRDERSNS